MGVFYAGEFPINEIIFFNNYLFGIILMVRTVRLFFDHPKPPQKIPVSSRGRRVKND